MNRDVATLSRILQAIRLRICEGFVPWSGLLIRERAGRRYPRILADPVSVRLAPACCEEGWFAPGRQRLPGNNGIFWSRHGCFCRTDGDWVNPGRTDGDYSFASAGPGRICRETAGCWIFNHLNPRE